MLNIKLQSKVLSKFTFMYLCLMCAKMFHMCSSKYLSTYNADIFLYGRDTVKFFNFVGISYYRRNSFLLINLLNISLIAQGSNYTYEVFY